MSHTNYSQKSNNSSSIEEHETIQTKRKSLCLRLPSNTNRLIIDQTPTPCGFVTNFIKNYEELGLNKIDELCRPESTKSKKDSQSNPFEETFRKAAKSKLLLDIQRDEPLNTPSIELRTLDQSPFLPLLHDQTDEDLLLFALEEATTTKKFNKNKNTIENDLDSHFKQPFSYSVGANCSRISENVKRICTRSRESMGQKKPHQILPKPTTDYQVFLKLPNGDSMPIPMLQQSPPSSSRFMRMDQSFFLNSKNDLKKQSESCQIVASKKSVQSYPQSSQLFTSIESIPNVQISLGESLGIEEVSQSSSIDSRSENHKLKVGRKARHEVKEDAEIKKMRSLERNRKAAMRCRTKKKVWMGALEEKADELENYNKQLQETVDKLTLEVSLFKTALLSHKDCPVGISEKVTETVKNSNLFDALLAAAKRESHDLLETQKI